MAGFFKNLFSKKDGGEERAAERPSSAPAGKKSELAKRSEACYRMGKEFVLKNDLERARLYLERASALYSNFEQVYDECEAFMYDCDEEIGALEEEELLFNELLDEVTMKAGELSGKQNYVWGILTLARFQVLLEKLSSCPGCGILGEIGKVLDLFSEGIRRELQPEEVGILQDFVLRIYDFGDSESFVNPDNQAPVEGGQPVQVFDLNGNSAFTSIHIFLDNCANLFEAGFDRADDAEPAELDFIPCTLMEDYYLRTVEGDIRRLPKLQEEIERIRSDFEFVKGAPDAEKIQERIRNWRGVDLLGA